MKILRVLLFFIALAIGIYTRYSNRHMSELQQLKLFWPRWLIVIV